MYRSYSSMEENEIHGSGFRMKQAELFGEYKLKVGHWNFTTFYDKRRELWRILNNARETFYNDKNEMMEWETEGEAIEHLEQSYSLSAKERFNNY